MAGDNLMKIKNRFRPFVLLVIVILAAGILNSVSASPAAEGVGAALASALQPDGKIVLGGYGSCGTSVCFAVIRYTEDGVLDTAFNGNGKVVTPFGASNSYISAVEIQSDGKIVAAGYVAYRASTGSYFHRVFALARYNVDGSLDNSFGEGGKVQTNLRSYVSEIKALAIAPDGKIVVAGRSNSLAVAARYNVDGSLDNTFDGDGIFTYTKALCANAVLVQPDGKIVFAGYRNSFNYYTFDYVTARLNENGSFDTSFNGNGIASAPTSLPGTYIAYALALQPDGKLLVSGSWYGYAGMYRYNPDGTLDETFGAGGFSYFYSNPNYHKIAFQPDGKIILAAGSGQRSNGRRGFLVIRLNPNGTVDQQINASGMIVTSVGRGEDVATGVVIQSSGRVVVTGYSSDPSTGLGRFAAVGLTPGAQLDTTFGNSGKVLSTIGYTGSSAGDLVFQDNEKDGGRR